MLQGLLVNVVYVNSPSNENKTLSLYSLPVSNCPWQDISMDFVLGLPKTVRKHDSILVVVHRFFKMTHFLPCFKTSDASRIATIYFNEVVRLHGLPKIIISDRDVKFTSYFLKTLWPKMRIKLQFSTENPQTDGQTEIVNRSLGNLLRYLVGEYLRAWDLVLPTAQLAYNSFINRTIRMSPFELVHGYQPTQPITLIPMAPHHTRMSKSAASFTSHIHDLHKEISNQIQKNNANYKAYAYLHRKAHEFNVGD